MSTAFIAGEAAGRAASVVAGVLGADGTAIAALPARPPARQARELGTTPQIGDPR
ncbi:hypothetical protein [Streptomyces sp. MZ04]|uniref:hypothetical protein n=1 Tax=Streptomyces sp. MZ04 TaxID=2559236 RepID=UPI0014332970|nr:hypothetical protein [Streptomyces sp. MZ04]